MQEHLRTLIDFVKTAPGRLPQRVQDAITSLMSTTPEPSSPSERALRAYAEWRDGPEPDAVRLKRYGTASEGGFVAGYLAALRSSEPSVEVEREPTGECVACGRRGATGMYRFQSGRDCCYPSCQAAKAADEEREELLRRVTHLAAAIGIARVRLDCDDVEGAKEILALRAESPVHVGERERDLLVKEIAVSDPWITSPGEEDHPECYFCGNSPHTEHEEECPWRRARALLAALRTASPEPKEPTPIDLRSNECNAGNHDGCLYDACICSCHFTDFGDEDLE